MACGGAEACVGAARFSLPAAAESITLRLTAGRLTQAGSMFADIRAAELERPVPATLGRGAVFAAPAEGETAEAVFTGEYPAGTYYAYLSSDSACAELRASGAAGLEIEYAAAADNAGRGLRGTAGQGGEGFEWYFTRLRAAPNSADCAVRGLWSGFVGGEEVLCAACGGYLWQLERSDGGVWSKTACGTVDTSEDVFMFGFDEKLYLLNGSQYRVWDGESLTDVAGYRPLVAVSAPPEGGGTSLEQVNKLCGQRRMRFSPDGSATTFHLPEREVQSIDYVRYVASGRRPHELRDGSRGRHRHHHARPGRGHEQPRGSAGRWAPIPPPRCAPCAARSSITASRTRAYSSTATGAAAASTPA